MLDSFWYNALPEVDGNVSRDPFTSLPYDKCATDGSAMGDYKLGVRFDLVSGSLTINGRETAKTST